MRIFVVSLFLGVALLLLSVGQRIEQARASAPSGYPAVTNEFNPKYIERWCVDGMVFVGFNTGRWVIVQEFIVNSKNGVRPRYCNERGN